MEDSQHRDGGQSSSSPPTPGAGIALGQPLSWRYRLVTACLRDFYFGCIGVLGYRRDPEAPRPPRLVIASHRNGAIDGYTVLAAFPRLRFLASVQLLRSRFLRLMFEGIPVVRAKDQRRYGLSAQAYADPVSAACAHLQAGGELGIFPEGTSEWRHAPGRYQRGAARIACALLDAGIALEVIPAGLFYSAPDRFRSRAEVLVGTPVDLPARDGRDDAEWLQLMHTTLANALDAVSVNCPDPVTFEQVQEQARQAMRQGASFAESFLRAQHLQQVAASTGTASDALPPPTDLPARWPRWLALMLMAAIAPVLLAGWLAGRKADGRNTVSFFRIAAGLAIALVWMPLLVAWGCWQPLPCAVALLAAVIGWSLLGVRRWRP